MPVFIYCVYIFKYIYLYTQVKCPFFEMFKCLRFWIFSDFRILIYTYEHVGHGIQFWVWNSFIVHVYLIHIDWRWFYAWVLTVTCHAKSNVGFFICGTMLVLQKCQILEHFWLWIFGLEMLNLYKLVMAINKNCLKTEKKQNGRSDTPAKEGKKKSFIISF